MRGPTPINILLVEDDPADVELTRRGLGRGKVQNRLWVVADGLDALAFLRRESPHHGVPRPDLVLLDLKLPHLDGRDVLLRIREEPRWHELPVVGPSPLCVRRPGPHAWRRRIVFRSRA